MQQVIISYYTSILCIILLWHIINPPTAGSGADLLPHTVMPMQTVTPTVATTVHSALFPSPTPTGSTSMTLHYSSVRLRL